jgi:protein ImuB
MSTASPICCLIAPALELQALLRAEPELRGQPVAILDGVRIGDCSPEAQRQAVRRGMTAAQAQAVCPSVELRPAATELLRGAQDALVDVAYSFSPYVEAAGPGCVYFDAGGLARLLPTATDLMREAAAAGQRVGLTLRIGLGAGKFAARLRACHGEGPLAELPVGALEPSAETQRVLAQWGLRTVGELAGLDPKAVGRRLGEAGALLSRRARSAVQGEWCDEPLCPSGVPETFQEGMELVAPLVDLESLAFVLRGVLDRLVARLECRALGAATLEVRLLLDPRGRHQVTVPLRAPTRQVPTMVTLCRLAIAARPPDRPVAGIQVTARAAPMAEDQLPLFGRVPVRPDAMAATVARVAAIVGADHVGRPVVIDTHRPDAQRLDEFAPPRALADPSPAIRAEAAPVTLALRWLPPTDEDDALRRVVGQRVVARAGPWRLDVEWWTAEAPRDYYAVRTAEGGLFLVCSRHDDWQVVGVFD